MKLKYNLSEICELKKCKTEKDKFVKKNYDVFTGLNKLPGKVSLKLNDYTIPKSFSPRRVPYKINIYYIIN